MRIAAKTLEVGRMDFFRRLNTGTLEGGVEGSAPDMTARLELAWNCVGVKALEHLLASEAVEGVQELDLGCNKL
ncbi:MAG TPA: hypothetical protein VLB44_02010, partial [Kofleriaceae bacterium]|nr:hypothetical protein [Kofleriaceae bacterium]